MINFKDLILVNLYKKNHLNVYVNDIFAMFCGQIIVNLGGIVMARKGENIHKRKDGRWEARIRITKLNGKTSYHSIYGKTYSEVKEKKEYYLKNRNQIAASFKKITFGEVLEMWLEHRFFHQKESTRLKYQNIINTHIKPVFGTIDINAIDEVFINRFLADKKEFGRIGKKGELSNSYIKTMAIIIDSVLSYAAEKDYRPPLKSKIQKPQIDKKEISVLPVETQKQLESALCHDDSKTALGILIALNTGLRIGEICALKWENVDLQNKIIRVKNSVVRVSDTGYGSQKTKYIVAEPKTKTSIRDIPITTKLYPILLNAKEKKVYVISDTNEFVCPRTFEYRFHRILEEYSIPDTNFHTLRHTFATRCVEKNVDTKSLSEILGHSNVSITLNYYVHPSFELKRNQLEKMCVI